MKTTFLLFLLLALSSSSYAASLVTYHFTQAADASGFPTSYPGFTRGNYLNPPQVVDPFPFLAGGASNSWDGPVLAAQVRRGGNPMSGFINIDTLDKAISNGAYFSILYIPADETSFSGIIFDAAGSGTSRITLRSSVTGTINLAQALINSSLNTGGQQTVDLDLSSYTELKNVTSPVTFTFYTDTNGGGNNSPTIYVDDLTINGSVNIPEPSLFGMLAVAGSTLLMRRRASRP